LAVVRREFIMCQRLAALLVVVSMAAFVVGCGGKEQAQPASKQYDDYDVAVGNVYTRYAETGYQSLADSEKALLCVYMLNGEVNNGGFDQFYFNSSGDIAWDTPRALEAMGAMKTANLARQANAMFGDEGPSADRAKRWKQMDALPEAAKKRWDELDTEFFRDEEHLYELLRQYVQTHRAAFGLKADR